MIIGTGIDIVELARIEALISKNEDKLLERIFAAEERERIPQSFSRETAYISGRFAAKEAAAKALGTGFGHKLSWHDICVMSDAAGKPYIQWNERLYPFFPFLQDSRTFLSISHEKKYAVAQVIIESPSS